MCVKLGLRASLSVTPIFLAWFSHSWGGFAPICCSHCLASGSVIHLILRQRNIPGGSDLPHVSSVETALASLRSTFYTAARASSFQPKLDHGRPLLRTLQRASISLTGKAEVPSMTSVSPPFPSTLHTHPPVASLASATSALPPAFSTPATWSSHCLWDTLLPQGLCTCCFLHPQSVSPFSHLPSSLASFPSQLSPR